MRWAPNSKQKTALKKLVSEVERIAVSTDCNFQNKNKDWVFDERSLFFSSQAKFKRRALPGENAFIEPDGFVTPRYHWAVVGGSTLVIARLQSNGQWVLRHLIATGSCNNPKTYRPLAVFDMNNDTFPEIIFNGNFIDSWSDSVLQLVNAGDEGEWKIVAESVHGSTA
jgi:hypothetical protein